MADRGARRQGARQAKMRDFVGGFLTWTESDPIMDKHEREL